MYAKFLVDTGASQMQISKTMAARLGVNLRKAENIPVYAVPFGGKVARRDLELVAGKRRYLAFAGQEQEIPVTVRSSNLSNLICQITLSDRDGKAIERRKLSIPENKTLSTMFKLKFDRPGYYQYEISLPEQKNEAIRWNNHSQIGVTVLRKKLNIFEAG